MSNIVRSLADVDLRGSLIFGKNLNSFPANPRQGEVVLKDGALWVYAAINGVSTWYPLTNKKNSYVHTQAVSAFQWTINHGLGTEDVIYAAYDESGQLLIVSRTPVSPDTFRLNFTSAVAGRVVVFADSERYASNLAVGTMTAASLSIADGTVTADNTEARLTAPIVRVMGDLNASGNGTVGGNLTVTGNLIVSGTQSQVNSTVVTVKDNIVVYNNGEIGSGVTNRYSGIQIDRGDLAGVRFVFDENDDKWKVGEVGNEIALVTAPEIAGFAAASSVYTKTESDARYLSAGITIDGGVL